jgi:hypothetical protein
MRTFSFAAFILIYAHTCLAQPGSGARFGARDPHTCGSRKEPARGAPTAAQLTQYFICDNEFFQPASATGPLLYLIDNAKVEVGKGRPFSIVTDAYTDVDPSQTVYPIRGSYTQYQCSVPQPPSAPFNAPKAGKNCFKYEAPAATGICYKSTFGEWHCKMCCTGSSSGKGGVELFPPPTK